MMGDMDTDVFSVKYQGYRNGFYCDNPFFVLVYEKLKRKIKE